MTTRTILRRFLFAAIATLPIVGTAQTFPDRPIRLVVPFAPGGSTDIAARMVSEEWAKKLGQPIVIENRPGAGGNIGVAQVAKATADGYTIGIQGVSLAINPALYAKMPYDTMKELAPIGTVVTSQHMLVVNNNMPVKSVQELISASKAEPGKFKYGSAGSGSTFHMAAELFKSLSGTDIVHIPYRGGGPAMQDTIGGHVDLSFPVLSAGLPQVQAGNLRALGVTGAQRSPLMPDTPTIAEAGLPGYDFGAWFMVFAPAGTPKPVIDKLNRALNEALDMPDLKARMVKDAFDPIPSTPEQATKMLVSDMAKWQELTKALGIKID